jgi:hypothetical protein
MKGTEMARGKQQGTKRGPNGSKAAEVYAFDSLEGTEWLLGMIIGAALQGHAIRVGLTRDMGALAIGVYKGGEAHTEYIRPTETLENEVREIITGYDLQWAVWDEEAGRWLPR